MAYPLDVGGVDGYPVKAGSMLLTMVDPNPGYEKAYNRWYERDHFYAGCMIGPFLFAGSRWVATRDLKDKRWPQTDTVARPYNAGSYISIYWVEEGHYDDHWTNWAGTQVRWLYANGRGFSERTHRHTVVCKRVGVNYRDDDAVPLDVALDHGYPNIAVIWLNGRDGMSAADLQAKLSQKLIPDLLKGSSIEIVSSWTPGAPSEEPPTGGPMDLGSAPGGPNRLVHVIFVGGDVTQELDRLRTYTDAVEKDGTGRHAARRSVPEDRSRHRQVRRPAVAAGCRSLGPALGAPTRIAGIEAWQVSLSIRWQS